MSKRAWRVGLFVVSCSSALVAACGPGPTAARKSNDPGLVVGGVPGSTTSAPAGAPGAQATKGSALDDRSIPTRVASAPTNDERRSLSEEEIASAGPVGDPGPDPMNGAFTIAQATAGLAPTGALVATIKTSRGEMRCRLFDDKAPVAVANFVGLARGTRPFKDKGQWVKRPAYDGTIFHRVIKGFMIQGGDPQGSGRGEPGYTFKDEVWPGAKHDRPGLLCMANRGPDTNGMQFFITDAAAPHLDKTYTIFGECAPVSVVHAIANVPTEAGDRPVRDVTIESVEITRGSAPVPPPAPKESLKR